PQPVGQDRRMGRFPGALAALKSDEPSVHLSAAARLASGHFGTTGWRRGAATYIRLAAERNKLITSSDAASMARCEIEPAATLSDAWTGTSSTCARPRQTCRLPMACPSRTGARTGPV